MPPDKREMTVGSKWAEAQKKKRACVGEPKAEPVKLKDRCIRLQVTGGHAKEVQDKHTSGS